MPDTPLDPNAGGSPFGSGSEGDRAENVPLTGVGTDTPLHEGGALTDADGLEQRDEVPPGPGGVHDLAGEELPREASAADVLEQAQDAGSSEDDYR